VAICFRVMDTCGCVCCCNGHVWPSVLGVMVTCGLVCWGEGHVCLSVLV